MSEASAAPAQATTRGRRKVRTGMVVSHAMQKTIVVRVGRFVRHPLYKRVIRRYSGLKAHDERNEAKAGDWVKIIETRPLSKDKRWRLVEIVRRASTAPRVPDAGSEVAARAPQPTPSPQPEPPAPPQEPAA